MMMRRGMGGWRRERERMKSGEVEGGGKYA